MEHMTDDTNAPCDDFLASLDVWLARELAEAHSLAMQIHHDCCAACQLETRLARAVTTITEALPEPQLPIVTDSSRNTTGGQRATPRRESLLSRLLATWQQPLVFAPALALVLLAVLVIQFRGAGPAVDPDIVIIDGQQFTREEILRATEDLELALRYLDKYGSYPARVVQAELEQSHLPLPPRADTTPPAI